MAAQLIEHGRAMLLHLVGVICAGKDGLGSDGTGWGRACRVQSAALAWRVFILDEWTSLFCWLVWTLLSSKHIITQQQCQLYLKPGTVLIILPARTPIQPNMFKVWGPTTVTQCHILCMCMSVYEWDSVYVCLTVFLHIVLGSVQRTVTMWRKKYENCGFLFSKCLFGLFLSRIMSTVLTNTCTVLPD